MTPRDEMIAEVKAGLASNRAGPVALARAMIRRYDLDIEDPLLERNLMDPDTTLEAARTAAALVATLNDTADTQEVPPDADALIATLAMALGHYQALDDWLTSGGFLPAAWFNPTMDQRPLSAGR
jgi:hypothetical protein